MMMPTPALNMRAIWFGPDDDSSPKRYTEDASSPDQHGDGDERLRQGRLGLSAVAGSRASRSWEG